MASRVVSSSGAGESPWADLHTAGGIPSSQGSKRRAASNILPLSARMPPLDGGRSQTLEHTPSYYRSSGPLTSEQNLYPNPISLNSSLSELSINSDKEKKSDQTFPPSESHLEAALEQPQDSGPFATKASSTSHYQHHSGSRKEQQRKQPSVHAWPHAVIREDEDKELVESIRPSLTPDAASHTTQREASPLIIAGRLTTSPHPISSSDPLTDQPLPDTPSTILQSSSSESASQLGRPTQLEDAPGNFNLEHIKVLKKNSHLLSAAKKTSRFQLEKKRIRKVGKQPFTKGSYGVVWEGALQDTTRSQSWVPFIIKKLFREVLPLCGLKHHNIVRIRGYVMNGRSAWIVTDWQNNGNCMDYLRKNPNADRLLLITGVVDGLCYLHSCQPQIIHGDLKGDNVLIGNDNSAKLIDLGLARILEETLGTAFTTSSMGRGCLQFLAPELYAGCLRTMESDIWALGCLILQIATDLLPFHGMKKNEVLAELHAKRAPKLEDYGEIPYNGLLQPIVKACWRIEPQERCTALQISSYLKKHSDDYHS
ncbi:hypothetical protein FRC02_003048 [Tulasnella sp. 418]|nr:hypothetical protein FRC02_003048 [Tulasnella sp. 418]